MILLLTLNFPKRCLESGAPQPNNNWEEI
jgi:hypothetical protein